MVKNGEDSKRLKKLITNEELLAREGELGRIDGVKLKKALRFTLKAALIYGLLICFPGKGKIKHFEGRRPVSVFK